MRALFGFCAAIFAIAVPFIACEDPATCPGVSPDDAGAAFAPQIGSGGHESPPLSCAYFDHCGEIVCVNNAADNTWTCKRNEDWNDCGDAGGANDS